jgi:hypothetical protein
VDDRPRGEKAASTIPGIPDSPEPGLRDGGIDGSEDAMSLSYAQSALRFPVLAARAAAVVTLGIAAFQVALVFGAPWSAYTQ